MAVYANARDIPAVISLDIKDLQWLLALLDMFDEHTACKMASMITGGFKATHSRQ